MASSTASHCGSRNISKYEYTLDIVSNGSEATEPTVFLSVLKRGGNDAELEVCDIQELSPVGRYALLGLGDMTARLVADQKFSWAFTKAVFCHNNHRHSSSSSSCCPFMGVNGGGLWGLPAILLALNQAGVPELTVVTGNNDDASIVETLAESLSLKAFPRLRIAAVPTAEPISKAVAWWKMYEDEFLLVHATCVGKIEHLIYLFTCRQHRTVANYTLAVLPCPHARSIFLDTWRDPEKKVVLESDHASMDATNRHLRIHSILAVGTGEDEQNFISNAQSICPDAHVFFCRQSGSRDARILVRASNMLNHWHNILPDNIIWRKLPPSPLLDDNEQQFSLGLDLPSFTSLHCAQIPRILDRKTIHWDPSEPQSPDDDDGVQSTKAFFQYSIVQEESSLHHEVASDCPIPAGSTDNIPCKPGVVDENEIDIDESDDDESTPDVNELSYGDCGNNAQQSATDGILGSDNGTKGTLAVNPGPSITTDYEEGNTSSGGMGNKDCPHLLVLGSGCAAPCPLRGSSGYGLLFPQLCENEKMDRGSSLSCEALMLTAILECGEGALLSLSRHLPSVGDTATDFDLHLQHVKMIWISHAHWDHYGGLPAVVTAICEAKMRHHRRRQAGAPHCSKRVKSGDSVLVVAPKKVLHYLDNALRCNHDLRNHREMTGSPLYQGFTHEQNPLWWPFLASIHLVRSEGSGPRRQAHKDQAHLNSIAYRPFAFWANVRVEHSCFGAFGFIAGLRIPDRNFSGELCSMTVNPTRQETLVTFAYSGDTRPSRGFIERCRSDCHAFSNGLLNYLLHEASFDDTEQALSAQKKHSSLSEALSVAQGVCAQKVILTHFSNRYVTHPPMKLPAQRRPMPIVFAMDGMLIPLAPNKTCI